MKPRLSSPAVNFLFFFFLAKFLSQFGNNSPTACGKAAVYAGCDLEPIPLRAPAPRAVLVGERFYSIG